MTGSLPAVFPILLAALAYANALHNPFVYDDFRVIVDNPHLAPPIDLIGLLSRDITRPLVTVSYALDRALWGPEPFGYHVTNLALHLVNVALVYGVARRLRVMPFVAASLFAVHPLMTEAVGYISGRSELLSTMFVLVAFLASERWTDGARWRIATLIFWVAGIFSKETAVMFPLLVAARDVFLPFDDAQVRRRRWRTLHQPLVTIAAVAAAARLFIFVAYEYGGPSQIVWEYLFSELDVTGRYLTLLAWPAGQTIFHGVPLVAQAFSLEAIRAWLTASGLIAGVWFCRTRLPVVSMGLVWFVASLVPSALLVALNRGEPMAEHRIYLASIGIFLGMGAIAEAARAALADARRFTRAALLAAFVMLLLSLTGRTIIRNAVWHTRVSLWSEAVGYAPSHWYPRQVLGEALHDAGRHADALAEFAMSIEAWPTGTAAWARSGVCLLELGRVDEAVATFGELERLDPGSAAASNGLAAAALLRGDLGEARSLFIRTLGRHPDNVEARRGLGLTQRDAEPTK